jgi:hypothetical protein
MMRLTYDFKYFEAAETVLLAHVFSNLRSGVLSGLQTSKTLSK